MTIVRRLMVGVVLLLAVAAYRPAPASEVSLASDSQTVSMILQPSADVVWARIPYCNCFGDSATANIAVALKDANLIVTLKELSPRDGWLYFVATFDSHSATWDQISAAIVAGGGQVIEGPP